MTSKQQSIALESSSQYLPPSGVPSNSTSQESSTRQPLDSMESSCKVGNGVLCGNARLQEAWEPDRKTSPDTPWRYVPTSTTPLSLEPIKSYPRESGESAENVQNVLQIMNKNQAIEMGSGHSYQAKKYFLNNTLEPFQQYANKSHGPTRAQTNPRLDRELLQQRMERKAAAMERELRLQKSLSEECEDLGVDEPSTSDLFPEADLLFDTNHSPSYDHSSQDASCSQSLGLKTTYTSSSYFRSLDSSGGSRDASPIASLDHKPNERRKGTVLQRTRTLKDTAKRAKKIEDAERPAKHIRLSYDNLSHDSGSSVSDVSRLSPGNMDSSKEPKLGSRNGSKEGTPSSSVSSAKLDMEMDSESVTANNVASSGDESLTLLGGSTADVTIPSPLSPIAGPLLSTHKYTYANKKRRANKHTRSDFMAWESPVSERTRSSSEDDDSSIGESVLSQNEDGIMTNGLEDGARIKVSDEHCAYLKKDKLQVNARVVLNRAEATAILAKHLKSPGDHHNFMSDPHSGDKLSEGSDDEHHHTSAEPDCPARRSSLRGHVKKGCACCNGSPERPRKKAPIKLDHGKLKKRLATKPLGKKR